MRGKALGLIETKGYLAAVEAADVCLKSANVTLVELEKVTSGLITIKVAGDVGAVKAAIDAAKIAVDKVGTLVSSHVIARPSEELQTMINQQNKEGSKIEEKTIEDEKENQEIELVIENKNEDSSKDNLEAEATEPKRTIKRNKALQTKDELINMKVVELRVLARQLEGIEIDKGEIKFARKKQLVKAILDCYEGGKE